MQIAYRVRTGENLNSVCARFGVSAESVRVLNRVVELSEGQMLVVELAEKRRHRVMPNETIKSISERYGISESDLLAENNVARLFIGQLLYIP